MRVPSYLLFIAMMGLAAVVAVSAAQAQQTSPAVAIVDVQALLRDSTAMKSVRNQIESERKKFQAEITKHEKEIRASMQALEKQKTVLSPAAYKQKANALQQQIAGVQRRVQGRRVVLEKAFAGAVNTFRKTLLDIVKKSARGRKLDLVMDKSQILYVAPKLDITKSILLDLNKRLPTLKVRIPSRTATKKSK